MGNLWSHSKLINSWDENDWNPHTKDIVNRLLMLVFFVILLLLLVIICFCARCNMLTDRLKSWLGQRPPSQATSSQTLQLKRTSRRSNGTENVGPRDGHGEQDTEKTTDQQNQDHFDKAETPSGKLISMHRGQGQERPTKEKQPQPPAVPKEPAKEPAKGPAKEPPKEPSKSNKTKPGEGPSIETV